MRSGIITAILLLAFAVTGFSQDKIFKKNGETILAKVSAINGETVVFKRFDNLEGPEYSIPKADVSRIRYVNGTEDIFEENNDRIGVVRKEPKGSNALHERIMTNNNIVSIAPLMFTEHGYGIGAFYEHSLDKGGWVNFSLPAIISFSPSTQNYSTGQQSTLTTYYLMPGVRVFTNLNSPKRLKFSIGPSLVAAIGKSYDYNSYNGYEIARNHFMLGAMVNIGFTLFATPRFCLGLEYGLGMTYLNKYDGVDKSITGLTQFSFKTGYRFHTGKTKPVSYKSE